MIRQIGTQEIVFFTFSAADLHWPELHDLMQDASRNVFTDQESSNNRYQDLINNPHIAA